MKSWLQQQYVIASNFGSIHSPAYSWVAFITNQRLIVSVEHGEVLREIFKAIMIRSSSHLRRVAYVRNRSAGMQNRYTVRWFAPAGWMQGCTYVRIWYRSVVWRVPTSVVWCVHTGVVWCVGAGVVRCVCTGIVRIRVYEFADTGVLHFCYGRTNLHVWA